MNPSIVIGSLVAASLGAAILKNEKQIRVWSLFGAMAAGFSIFYTAWPVLFGVSPQWSGDIWLMDNFSALMVSLVAFVYMTATLVSVRYIGHEYKERIIALSDVKIYFSLIHLFVASVVAATLANNTLLLWIALEATTLSSTFLVGLYHKKTSIEAAWKYIIICSTGITLGLIGILLLGYGLFAGNPEGDNIFLLTTLVQNAGLISGEIVRWAFVFIFVGFGAKVGLAPMHTWLPDAHSKAPSPVSALFSGILLNVALYAIIRFKLVVDVSLGGSDWTNRLFLIFGVLSVLIPAFMLLVQNNYKRMLAYSSVEHMGIISFALSLSPLGAAAAIIHMIGHTLTKSLLFFGAGEILLAWKTTKTNRVRGLLAQAPYTSILFLIGILFIVAIPPSVLFVSEYQLFSAAVVNRPIISLALFGALSIIAYAMLRSTISMFAMGKSRDAGCAFLPKGKEKWNVTHSVMVLQLAVLTGLAVWFSGGRGIDFIGSIAKDVISVSVNK